MLIAYTKIAKREFSKKAEAPATRGLPSELCVTPAKERSSPTCMHTLTVTSAAEADLEPSKLYSILAEASNIPKWAPAFADAIERINDTHYRVTKNGDAFNLEVSLHQSAGAVDYIREMPGGKRGGAYIRVTPRPLGGSTVTMTAPIGPNTTESEVANTLKQELADLIRLAQS